MRRWFRVLAVVGLLNVVVGASWSITARSINRTAMYLPEGQAVAVPGTDLSLAYNGIGTATKVARDGEDHESFISYCLIHPDGSEETLYDSLQGRELWPWRVVRVEGEWGMAQPGPPVLKWLRYQLRLAEPPDSAVMVRLERLDR